MFIRREAYVDMKAEIATLKERVTALALQVLDLQERAQDLTEAIEAEKARANIAVDRLLEHKGAAPITPIKSPTLEELSGIFEEDEQEVRFIRQAIRERGAESVLLESE